jgi:hypothetical protein
MSPRTEGTVLASAARTATVASELFTNYDYRGIDLVIDVTAASGTPSVVFTIQGYDPLSTKYYTILASAAITATGTTTLRVYPGLSAAANTVANFALPRNWRVNAVHGEGSSITYSVGFSAMK